MAKKKTDSEFKKQMFDLNSNIEILGVYEGNKIKIKCRCTICGKEWSATPNNLLRGHGCPGCKSINITKRQTYNIDTVLSIFKKTHGDKYDYSKVDYINSTTKVEIICPIHGSFWQTPDAHIIGQGCPMCFEEKRGSWSLKTTEQFINEAIKIHGNKYDYSKVNYINCNKPVCIICPIHGEFWLTPSVHLANHGCVKCTGKEIFNTESFIQKARQIHGDKYDYSKVDYIKTDDKVIIICPEHGEFELTPHSHISDKAGCPKCSQSHGETLVENFLIENNIKYIGQHPINIETSISGNAYIDFYLPEYNLFIEYNGIQHYIPIEYFGGVLLFEKLLIRDNSIREYCESNSIKLLEISYKLTDKEVINLLHDYLYEH